MKTDAKVRDFFSYLCEYFHTLVKKYFETLLFIKDPAGLRIGYYCF